jgi:hypothetical protein
MESFKHSCPFCGQHVEYTAGYCGQQIKCPICGNAITLPAASGRRLRLDRPVAGSAKTSWNAKSIFAFLRDYPHWKTVAQITTPFLILGALLVGANYVKKNYADKPAASPAPAEADVQADPDAWRKMTDLTRADQAVQEQCKVVSSWHAALKQAQRVSAAVHRQYSDGSNPLAVTKADEAAARAQNGYMAAYQRFQSLNSDYQRLGGTVDYARQLSN